MHNSFGECFRITTFGESHGAGIGVVIDGCPAGLPLEKGEIDAALARRKPGSLPYTSPRKEPDSVEILSGVFQGQTTGAPIALWIRNQDADSSAYASAQDLLRPGHANYTYLEKYGIFDFRGGGRASARETAARVAAGAVAQKLLFSLHGTRAKGFLSGVGNITFSPPLDWIPPEKDGLLFCPDPEVANAMARTLEAALEEGDSLGGVVSCIVHPMPVGLGDPIYRKLEALLAFAMLSLPASKGFEIGAGFLSSTMCGSKHNDRFIVKDHEITSETNVAGGTLGGISTGKPLVFRVAFKPPSSIAKPQETVTTRGEKAILTLSPRARHDPCVAIRAVPVVEAMAALVLVDLALSKRLSKI